MALSAVDQPGGGPNQGSPVPGRLALVLRLVDAGLRRQSHPQASLGTFVLAAPPNKSSLSLPACRFKAVSLLLLLSPPSPSVPPGPPIAFPRACSPSCFCFPFIQFFRFPHFDSRSFIPAAAFLSRPETTAEQTRSVTVKTFGPVLWPSVHYESNRLLFNTHRVFAISQPIRYFASARLVAYSQRRTTPFANHQSDDLLPASSASDPLNGALSLLTGLRLAQLRLSTFDNRHREVLWESGGLYRDFDFAIVTAILMIAFDCGFI